MKWVMTAVGLGMIACGGVTVVATAITGGGENSWWGWYGIYGLCIGGIGVIWTALIVAVNSGPHRRRTRRRERGECLQCGYNLTGNTSGVCPECSQKIERDNG